MPERLNLREIREFMAEGGIDACILMSPALAEYVTGLMPLEHRDFCPEERSMMFVFLRDSGSFVVFRNQALYPGVNFQIFSDVYPCPLMLAEKTEVLITQLKRRGFIKGRIGVEMDFMPALVSESLLREFPGSSFADISPLARQLMVPKDEYQLSCIAQALAASEAGLRAMFGELARRARKDLAAPRQEMYDIFREAISPFRVQCFDSYHLVQDGNVEKDRLTFFDIVTAYKGYLADICLPYYMGPNPSQELVERVATGEEIIGSIAAAVQLGMTGEAAEQTIDDRLKRVFGGKYSSLNIEDRWVIHGLGIRIHEEPLLGADYRAPSRNAIKKLIRFEKGCVISIEIRGLMEQMHQMTANGLVPVGKMPPRLYTPLDPG